MFNIETPLILAHSDVASALNVKAVYYKLDNLQPTGSFKIRGMSYQLINALKSNPSLQRVISSSGGNAGLAAAYVSSKLGLKCTVFVPNTTSKLTIQRLKDLDAEVIISGNVWDEANSTAHEFLCQCNTGSVQAVFVHPFEGSDLWEGHSGIIDEIIRQLPSVDNFDAIVCSVGGGGLISGIMTGVLKNSDQLKSLHVVGVETQGAASYSAALKASRVVKIDSITSIAKSLGALSISESVLELRSKIGENKVVSQVVSDSQAVEALVKFANENRMLVEPACAASLATVLISSVSLRQSLPNLTENSVVVIVVCGGSGVTLEQIHQWQTELKEE